MTNGTGPRRRRRLSSSRDDDPDDGDWLAGYRPSPDEQFDFDEPGPVTSRRRVEATEVQATAVEATAIEAIEPVPAASAYPKHAESPFDDGPPRRAAKKRRVAPDNTGSGPHGVPGGDVETPARSERPERDGRLPGEEPIFRRLDPLPPGSPPPVPVEEPILRFMTPRTRQRPGSLFADDPLPVQAPTTGTPPARRRHARVDDDDQPAYAYGWSHRSDDELPPAPRWEPSRDQGSAPDASRRRAASEPRDTPDRPSPRRRHAMSSPEPQAGQGTPALLPHDEPAAAAPPAGGVRQRRPDDSRSQPTVDTSGSMRPVRADHPGAMRATRATTTNLPRMSSTTSGSLRKIAIDPVQPMHKPHSRWILALSAVGVLAMLAVCGLGTYFMFKDERNGPADARKADASASPTLPRRDISTREIDPIPLTEAEVFPGATVPGSLNEPPYTVLKTQASADCAVAATDQLGALMKQLGCSQVVRGTLKSPDGLYLITAGIFNLQQESGATQAHENIKPTIDAQKGRFTGLVAGAGTEVIVRAPTILGWQARGHFLAYCVIAPADGKAFDPNDQVPTKIQADVLTAHLRDDVIGARAVVPPSPPSGQATATPAR